MKKQVVGLILIAALMAACQPDGASGSIGRGENHAEGGGRRNISGRHRSECGGRSGEDRVFDADRR